MDQSIDLVHDLEKRVAVDEALRAALAHVADHLGNVAAGAEAFVARAVARSTATMPSSDCRAAQTLQQQLAHLEVQRIELPLPVQRGMADAVAAGGLAFLEYDGR